MKSSNNDLRELFQAYIGSKSKGVGTVCPTLEALTSSFELGEPARKKKKIIDHLSDCPTCREEFRLYFDLQKFPLEEHLFGASPMSGCPHGARRHPAIPLLKYAAIVVGACLITSAVILFLNDAKISETERAGAAEIVLVSPLSSIAGPEELVFRWEAYSRADYFIVELFDEDLLPVWDSQHVDGIQVRVPSEQQLDMRHGTVYFWMVTAYSEGIKIAESRLARFKIAAKWKGTRSLP